LLNAKKQLVGQANDKLPLLYLQLGLSTWLQPQQQKKQWLRRLLCDLGEDSKDGTIIYCDNQIIVMTFLVRECYGSPKKQEF